MQPIIKVENLGKSYLIGHQREKYVALRDVLANKTRQMVSKTKNILAGGQLIAGNEVEEFWALKDINFEVQQGDRVGIIGRNGAGKSTLLKVLSRITEPTTGRIRLKGRVASLLEVGTGFHPELSGRENIYLNGAILGMSQVEVRKKFDEIVDFAGVEKFLDTPVKRYSSGMYVRLAFAVAAHLEPEILIIDEVLAVGDAEFQKKCLGKMEDVSKNDGRTVLFVSHNMGAISSLCNITVILNNGSIQAIGPTAKMINEYTKHGKAHLGETMDEAPPRMNQKLKIRKVKILNGQKITSSILNNEGRGYIEITWEVFIEGKGYNVGLELHSSQFGCIFTTCLKDYEIKKFDSFYQNKGLHAYTVELPLSILHGGDYWVVANSAIPNREVLDEYKHETMFSITDLISPIALSTEGRRGCIIPVIKWENNF